jgi:hypothetical protein
MNSEFLCYEGCIYRSTGGRQACVWSFRSEPIKKKSSIEHMIASETRYVDCKIEDHSYYGVGVEIPIQLNLSL